MVLPNNPKCPEDIWVEVKGMLNKFPEIGIDWSSEFPSDEDFQHIHEKKLDFLLNPKEPVDPKECITEIIEQTIPKLEDFWGRKIIEKPSIEIVP